MNSGSDNYMVGLRKLPGTNFIKIKPRPDFKIEKNMMTCIPNKQMSMEDKMLRKREVQDRIASISNKNSVVSKLVDTEKKRNDQSFFRTNTYTSNMELPSREEIMDSERRMIFNRGDVFDNVRTLYQPLSLKQEDAEYNSMYADRLISGAKIFRGLGPYIDVVSRSYIAPGDEIDVRDAEIMEGIQVIDNGMLSNVSRLNHVEDNYTKQKSLTKFDSGMVVVDNKLQKRLISDIASICNTRQAKLHDDVVNEIALTCKQYIEEKKENVISLNEYNTVMIETLYKHNIENNNIKRLESLTELSNILIEANIRVTPENQNDITECIKNTRSLIELKSDLIKQIDRSKTTNDIDSSKSVRYIDLLQKQSNSLIKIMSRSCNSDVKKRKLVYLIEKNANMIETLTRKMNTDDKKVIAAHLTKYKETMLLNNTKEYNEESVLRKTILLQNIQCNLLEQRIAKKNIFEKTRKLKLLNELKSSIVSTNNNRHAMYLDCVTQLENRFEKRFDILLHKYNSDMIDNNTKLYIVDEIKRSVDMLEEYKQDMTKMKFKSYDDYNSFRKQIVEEFDNEMIKSNTSLYIDDNNDRTKAVFLEEDNSDKHFKTKRTVTITTKKNKVKRNTDDTHDSLQLRVTRNYYDDE
jgi:hypothetical protein